ncbi:hypothetical protein CSB09_00235 [Candidatus Gracilibacteria bacterium]|nr:MAG: hypothetical protein CSB09_00235 [Candidatus Gracilibacteria bacterium]
MKIFFTTFLVLLSFSFGGCKGTQDTSILPLTVSKGNTQIHGTVYKIGNTYITTAHSVGDDIAFLSVGKKTNCTLQEKDTKRDIAWMICGDDASFQKKYPNPARKGENIQVGVYRNGSLQFLTGTILDPSTHIRGIDGYGNMHTISGGIKTNLNFLSGDSGAPIFSLETGQWIGIVHTQ